MAIATSGAAGGGSSGPSTALTKALAALVTEVGAGDALPLALCAFVGTGDASSPTSSSSTSTASA